MKLNTVKKTINLDPNEWEKFKRIAKNRGSDATKEIRNYIKEYNKKHKEDDPVGNLFL